MQHKPAPMFNPATKQPVTEEELSNLCPRIGQELNTTDRYIEIPMA